MLVILSQKVDSESLYSDELFASYHYPARYKSQLHEGDIFVYYQGNRYDKSQRYYFGTGTVGKIRTADGENYYAELINCLHFKEKIPIYLPDGGYIEQLGYRSVHNNINPPWQSSVRPLSREAYDYILNAANINPAPEITDTDSVDILKDKLKSAVKEFYVKGDFSAIYRIESIAAAIGQSAFASGGENENRKTTGSSPADSSGRELSAFLDYCKTTKMIYSYKPVLILALFQSGNEDGCISIQTAAAWFRNFYSTRKAQNLPIEKKPCIYLRDDTTDKEIISNLVTNPVAALVGSGYFFYDKNSQILSVSPEIWHMADAAAKIKVIEICHQRLRDYYEE